MVLAFAQKSKKPTSLQARRGRVKKQAAALSRIEQAQFAVGFGQPSRVSIGAPMIKTKLKIGEPDDQYEKEADRVADAVMRMPDPMATAAPADTDVLDLGNQLKNGSLAIQRMCTDCAMEEDKLRRKPVADNTPILPRISALNGPVAARFPVPAVTPGVEAGINSLKGGGQPMSMSTRAFFEPRFGVDFSGVRVHADGRAAQVAQAVQAKAFTTGRNVVLGVGEYTPSSASGKKLLAHELTHVVQQNVAYKFSNSRFPNLKRASDLDRPNIQRYSLRSEHKKKYPNLSKFVNTLSSRFTSTTKKAFKKWSTRSNPPSIGGKPDIVPADCGCDVDKTGRLKGVHQAMTFSKNVVGINTIVIRGFENAVNVRKANLVDWETFLESVIMHELVHWGRLMEGKKDWDDELYPENFEKDAYGRIVKSPEKLCIEKREVVEHTVLAGESLVQIAEKYYEDIPKGSAALMWHQIYLANRLTGSPSLIDHLVGKKLILPNPAKYKPGVSKYKVLEAF